MRVALICVTVLLSVACPKAPPKTGPEQKTGSKQKTSPLSRETQAVGVFHRLQAGETLWAVARRYGVDVNELLEVNGIDDPKSLKVGRLIFIPDVDSMAPTPAGQHSAEDSGAAPASTSGVSRSPARPKGQLPLIWPVNEGVLYSGFGKRQGMQHDGIDLGAPVGTAIVAAAKGEVIYVGFDRAFGNLVILRHDKKLVTVYAHNRDVSVHIGQKVKQGQVIAHVGASGRSQGPHLHFEVREGKNAVDPLAYLPAD